MSKPRGTYSRVLHSTWHDAWFFVAGFTTKLTWLYLLTAPSTNRAGFHEWSPALAASLTGLSREDVEQALKEMMEADKVVVVEDTVFIRNFHRIWLDISGDTWQNRGEAVKFVIGEDPALQEVFLNEYPDHALEYPYGWAKEEEPPAPKPRTKKAKDPKDPKDDAALSTATKKGPQPKDQELKVRAALVQVSGMDAEHLTSDDHKVLSSYSRKVWESDCTERDVFTRAQLYRDSVDWTFTIHALMKWWSIIPSWKDNPPKRGASEKTLAQKLLGR